MRRGRRGLPLLLLVPVVLGAGPVRMARWGMVDDPAKAPDTRFFRMTPRS